MSYKILIDIFNVTIEIRQLMAWSLFFVVIITTLCSADDLSTTPKQTAKSNLPVPELKEIEVSGPYCGIYSLITCMEVYGVQADLQTLLSPEYVGSFQGSSDKELIAAAEKYGLYGKTYGNLTWRELQKANTPMILHVRNSHADQKFNHWVAFLGMEDNKARIIDVPHQLATTPLAELMAKWDGTVIIISDKPIPEQVYSLARLNYLWFVMLLFGSMFCIQHFFWSSTKEPSASPTFKLRLQRGVFQSILLLGLIFVISLFYHATSEIGLLRNPVAVAEVTRRYYSVDIPEIPLDELKNIVAENKTPIFDARYISDYKYGTIPNAKTFSINSSLQERQQQLRGISKEQRIIVFCQSSGCTYSDEIAQFLKFNGYNRVAIYRGGYREWQKNEQKHGAKP
ncbi:MAG: hypothetical protein LBP59_09145 [Planctomycetaceae bacterium]|nr:hypothetical protein [Planctomycetaceae bacterium]